MGENEQDDMPRGVEVMAGERLVDASRYWPANGWSVEVLSGPAPLPKGVPASVSDTATIIVDGDGAGDPGHNVTYEPVTVRVEPGEAWLMVTEPGSGNYWTFVSMHLTKFSVGDEGDTSMRLVGLVEQDDGAVRTGVWLARPYKPTRERRDEVDAQLRNLLEGPS